MTLEHRYRQLLRLAGELPADSLVVAAMVVSALALVGIGISRPRVLLAGAVLSTPLFAAGFGQLIEAVTIHDPRPGRAVAEISLAIAIVAVSLMPTLALLAAGSAVTLRQSRRGATSRISTGRVGW